MLIRQKLRTLILASAVPPVVASCGLLSSLSGVEDTRKFAIPTVGGDAMVVRVENRDASRIVELSDKKTDFEALAATLPPAPPVSVAPAVIGDRTLLTMTRRAETVELAGTETAIGSTGNVSLALTRELELDRLGRNHSGDAGAPTAERNVAQVVQPALMLTRTLEADQPARTNDKNAMRATPNFQVRAEERLVLSLAQMLAI